MANKIDLPPEPDRNYPWTAIGFASLFADFIRDRMRFNRTANTWFYYDGMSWKSDLQALIAAREAKDFVQRLLRYASTINDDEKRSKYIEAVRGFNKLSARESLVKDARELVFLDREDFDQSHLLFNAKNGTLNLETGEFQKHNSADLLTKIAGARYDPTIGYEDFENFVSIIMEGNRENIAFLQRFFGYALEGTASEECALFQYGPTTRNGKGTFNYAMLKMFGDYGMSAQPETLAQRKFKDSSRPSGDIARLDGCRFLNVTEPPKNMLIDAALLKQLTGRDPITARHLMEREFSFIPRFAMAMNMNYRPFIDDQTLFESGRILVIEFKRHFSKAEQDPHLKEKLTTKESLSGILNWCLAGLKMYRMEGLNPPPEVIDATNRYRNTADEIGVFISENLQPSKSNIAAGSAYQLYCDWCSDNGYGAKTKSGFFRELSVRNMLIPSGTVGGKTVKNVIHGYEIAL